MINRLSFTYICCFIWCCCFILMQLVLKCLIYCLFYRLRKLLLTFWRISGTYFIHNFILIITGWISLLTNQLFISSSKLLFTKEEFSLLIRWSSKSLSEKDLKWPFQEIFRHSKFSCLMFGNLILSINFFHECLVNWIFKQISENVGQGSEKILH